MSIINQAMASCTQCGEKTAVNIYKSINVSENPELKAKVMDGSLFLWECPKCSKVNLAKYETLYHDPETRLMVWLVYSEISETQMAAIANHTKAMGGYTLRIVGDTGSLMEKVLIHDAGLSDAGIELCKWVTKMEMASKAGEQAAEIFSTPLKFFKVEGEGEDRVMTFMFPSQGQMVGMKIGINVYQDCMAILDRNPHARPGEGFIRIDSSWVDSIVR